MPLLGGLFQRRQPPSRHTSATATESVASSASNRDSTDGDYVLPDLSLPPPSSMYSLPPATSSSKLRLPFRRKAAPPPLPDPKGTRPVASLNDGPSPHISSVASDSGHGLPPPPRKSSIFAAYNESLPSIHSLPNQSSTRTFPDTPSNPSSSDARSDLHSPFAAQAHKKSPGLFSWARERTKSKPTLPPASVVSSVSSTSPSVHDSSSFNLKSFRHVRADSPAASSETPSQPSPLLAPPPPRPRPRGDSMASDSSQRISIAAFREAQARSRANSPVPSFRPPSAADTLRIDANGRKRASTVSVVSGNDRPQPNKNAVTNPMSSSRPDSSALDTSSDDSDSDSDEEVDSDGVPVPKPGRKRTVTHRVDGSRARSDAGHSSSPTVIDQTSHSRQESPKQSQPAPPRFTHQSDQVSFTRPRASVSTSALTPSGAARRASVLAATNPSYARFKHPSRTPKDDIDASTGSEDTDSEDMPLSGLVLPRRPGSSASNQSNSRPRMPARPLIDINSLAGGPPLLTPILRHEDSVRKANANRKEPDVEKDQPFSIPAALALSSSTSPPISPSASKQNPLQVNKPASMAHHRRSSSNMSAQEPDDDEDLMNAIRLVGVLDDESSGGAKPSAKSPSSHIVPTPIREREPPTSFTVLSRPQRQSTSEPLASLSPRSQAQFDVAARPMHPSQPGISARRRAPSTTNSTVQKDKAGATSVSPAMQSSTSRSSSIPPMPLIHSIPDSPSVKEGYKPGRPRSTSSASETKSAVSSATSNNILPHGSRPSLMPQRPFASNSSVQGESPAGSSTGDSSSGRSPFTPRDGSDIGVRSKDDASDVGSTLKARGHAKKSSVTFDDPLVRGRERERAKTDLSREQKTRERRRSEAKAAIELGKIVNGRRPLVHDDSDEDVELRGRNPAIHVTMDNSMHGTMQPSWPPWQQPMATGMTPMVSPQLSNDPAYLAAHQRALLAAKQAYQMAVAQHAMQIAGEEWERSSNAGFGSGGSVYGGGSSGSVYGGGSGGSVYGGGGGSVYGGMGAMGPVGMMSMPNMGMLMPPNQWGRSSVAFPTAAASVYGGISSSRSEYGGTGGWGTQSLYGNPFGPSSSRSNLANGIPTSTASAYGGSSRPRAWTGVNSSSTSPTQPAKATGKGPARSRVPPPSSWKNGR